MMTPRSTKLRWLYRFVAPVYTSMRPIWTGTIYRAAEAYLETEVLPKVLTPNAAILDLGCGPGINLKRLKRLDLAFARYVGLDLSFDMLAARQITAAPFVQGNAERLPFAAHSFDLVISTWLFSHLSNPLRVMLDAKHLLRPGGCMVVVCFSRTKSLPWGLLRPIERFFLVECVPPQEIRSWPGDVQVRFFARGYNTVATLYYERSG